MEIRCGHLTAPQPQSPVIPALSFLTDHSGWLTFHVLVTCLVPLTLEDLLWSPFAFHL